jgi:hypothetical protein
MVATGGPILIITHKDLSCRRLNERIEMGIGADKLPIRDFVDQQFHSKQIQELVEPWRLENDVIVALLVRYFLDMGIFKVSNSQTNQMVATMMHHLTNSHEITQAVSKAHRQEQLRTRNRHFE